MRKHVRKLRHTKRVCARRGRRRRRGFSTARLDGRQGPGKGLGRKRRMVGETVNALCNGCGNKCGMTVYVKDGRLWKFEGRKDHPYVKGAPCGRGQAYPAVLHSEAHRNTARKNGGRHVRSRRAGRSPGRNRGENHGELPGEGHYAPGRTSDARLLHAAFHVRAGIPPTISRTPRSTTWTSSR